MGYRVLEFSEIQNLEECYFVVAMLEKNANAVIEVLKAKNCNYCIID